MYTIIYTSIGSTHHGEVYSHQKHRQWGHDRDQTLGGVSISPQVPIDQIHQIDQIVDPGA